MNKAFKVLWNQVRNTYVVASEAQTMHGKPGKATKTIVAAAVAGLMAVGGTAFAKDDITYGYVTGTEGTSKFISGDGEVLNIKTDASIGQLLTDLQQAKSKGLQAILAALSQQKPGQETTTLIGVTGGSNFLDESGHYFLSLLGEQGADIGSIGEYAQKIAQQFNKDGIKDKLSLSTEINVGDSEHEPVVIAMTGSDLVVNSGFHASSEDQELTAGPLTVERKGNSEINFNSGNSIGVIGASTAINISGGMLDTILAAPSTTAILDGNATLNIGAMEDIENQGANVVGAFGAGAAFAVGGVSTSNVTGKSTINVNSTVDSSQLEGLTIGIFGAGFSLATNNGEASTEVQSTEINLEKGMILGTIGGGLATTSDPSIITNLISNSTVGTLVGLLDKTGGTSTSKVLGDTTINATAGSTTALLMGGGIAIANAEAGSSQATAETIGTITINLEGSDNVFKDAEGSESNKIAFHKAAKEFIDFGKTVFTQLTSDKVGFDVQGFITGLQDSVENLNYEGVHVGNLGSGIAIARGTNDIDKAEANSKVGVVNFNLKGGYNVANLAGGVAVAFGASTTTDGQVVASTQTDVVNVNIEGGDNILVAGGGAAYATAGSGYESQVKANSIVDSVAMSVTGGTTDGIYGGGIAIDDTNSSDTNATATTKNISVTVTGGEVNEANVDPIVSIAQGDVTNGAPTNGAYVNDTAYLIDAGNVAILGAGMASGGGALADTETSIINLNGGTITGSVFGGGAATFGGQTTVETSVITVAGADITGDIYGGGLVGSPRNDEANSDYQGATSTVSDSTIKLLSGTVNGDVYAGGYVFKDQESPKAVVTNSNIVLGSNSILTKGDAKLDGQGAETSTLTFVTDDFDMTGKTVIGFNTVDGSAQSVTGLAYSFGEKSQTDVLGNIAFTSVAGGDGKTMNIGTADRTGVASIKTLTDATIFNVANGLLALNTDSTDAAVSVFAGAGAQNAVYVTGTVDNTYLAGSTVKVGDVADALNPGIYVGTNGALIADADGDTSVESLTMNEGSKVHFADVALASEKGSVVVINVDESIATSVDNVLYTAVRNEGDKVSYTFTQRSAEDLDEVGLGDVDDTEALGDISHQDDDASEYIKGFLDQSNTSIDSTNRSQQINAAMNLAAAAGVQTVAIDSAAMGIDAAAKRASLINDFAEGGVLFAEATGKRFEMGGSSDFGAIKADLGGIVVGGEYTTNDWTFGALANLGTGTVRGQDTNSGVKNDVDYYGVQAYAAKRFGSFNVVGQVGYVTTSNDVSHATAALDKADIDADVMSVGVRGEMRFDLTQNTRLVPYVGVNYLRVSTDGFHTKQGLEVKDQDQDIVTIPVGVKFAGDMQTASGWKWTPSMDIGYVAALGDRDTDARTKVGATTVHTSMDVWSESVVRTSFGLKAQKENWGFGVQAGSALGSDDTQELFGQVRVDYRF